MDAYSLDLSKKIVEAKERGVPTVEVARTFGVDLSWDSPPSSATPPRRAR
jgi:hypothetical protein